MDTIIFYLIVLIFSVVIHEVSHGYVALLLGDTTAKDSGRLTLNPLPHLDPVGSFLVPLLLLLMTGGQGPIFGWAKPVPVNPHNLRNARWDSAKVAAAGAASNLALALVFGMALRFFQLPAQLALSFNIIVLLNLLLGIFNLVPIPPLDGSKILLALLPDRFWQFKMWLEQYGMIILLFFLFFGFSWLFPLIFFVYYFIIGSFPSF